MSSGNGLLPGGTKPLPKPMLIYHHWGPVTFIWRQFHKRYIPQPSITEISLKITCTKFHSNLWGDNELKVIETIWRPNLRYIIIWRFPSLCYNLTHCSLLMSYVHIDLGRHWLKKPYWNPLARPAVLLAQSRQSVEYAKCWIHMDG